MLYRQRMPYGEIDVSTAKKRKAEERTGYEQGRWRRQMQTHFRDPKKGPEFRDRVDDFIDSA